MRTAFIVKTALGGSYRFYSWADAPEFSAKNSYPVEFAGESYEEEAWADYIIGRQRAEVWPEPKPAMPVAPYVPKSPGDPPRDNSYYEGDIEWIEYKRKTLCPQSFRDLCVSLADKYLARLGKKNAVEEELKKSIWYLLFLREVELGNNPTSDDIHKMMTRLYATSD